jgi:hypothetical protein
MEKQLKELTVRQPSEEHQRQVRLMLNGAFDSPVFACWQVKDEKTVKEDQEDRDETQI